MHARLHRNRAFRLVVCLALLAALSGWMQLNLGLTVDADDTVTGQLLLTAEKSLLRSLSPGPVIRPDRPDLPLVRPWRNNIPAAFNELRRQLPALPAGTETPYENERFYGVLVSYQKKPLAEFRSESVNLTREGDLYRFTVTLDPSRYGGNGAQPNPQAQQEFLRAMSFEISVTFPGRVLEANGTLNGRSVSWKLVADQTKPAELRAVAEAAATPAASAADRTSGGSFPWLLVAGGVTALLVVAVLVVLLLRRPRGPAAAPTATTPAPAPQAHHPGPA